MVMVECWVAQILAIENRVITVMFDKNYCNDIFEDNIIKNMNKNTNIYRNIHTNICIYKHSYKHTYKHIYNPIGLA